MASKTLGNLFRKSNANESLDFVDMDKAFDNMLYSARNADGYKSMIDEIKTQDPETSAIITMRNMCMENYTHDMGNGLYFTTRCQYDDNGEIKHIALYDNARNSIVGSLDVTDLHRERLDKEITLAAAGELCEHHIRPNSVTFRGRDGVDPLDSKYAEIMQANAQILKKSPVINSVSIQAKDDNVKLEHGYSVDESSQSGKSRESHIVTPNGSIFTVSKDGNTTGIDRIIKKNGSEINLTAVGQLNIQYQKTGAEKSAVIKGPCAEWMNKSNEGLSVNKTAECEMP